MVSPFTTYLAEHYAQLKNLATELGRRRTKLRLLAGFWALSAEEKERLARLTEEPESQRILSDALEDINRLNGEDEGQIAEYVDEASVAGIVVRTDFSDETAWVSFVEALMEAERDLAMPIDEEEGTTIGEASGSATQGEEGGESESESEDEEMASPSHSTSNSPSASSPASLFVFLSPPASSPLRARFTGVSNLTALRLVNEADAVRAPLPPTGIQRAKSDSVGHRLTGLHGFVEAYSGPLVWVYDARSNTDRAARVVSQCAEGVGAATADSWRARASFLPELQLNLVSGAMKIDFGGLDRWDHGERQRNMAEADTCELQLESE